jgi:hypothetical protein
MRAYHDTFGWGPWSIFELRAPLIHDTSAEGKPGQCEMLAAIAPAGPVDIELFQPLGPGPLADFVDQRGEGVHHLLCRRTDGEDGSLDSELRALSAVAPVIEGVVGDDLAFSYLDLEATLKVIVETLDGAAEAFEPSRIWPPA